MHRAPASEFIMQDRQLAVKRSYYPEMTLLLKIGGKFLAIGVALAMFWIGYVSSAMSQVPISRDQAIDLAKAKISPAPVLTSAEAVFEAAFDPYRNFSAIRNGPQKNDAEIGEWERRTRGRAVWIVTLRWDKGANEKDTYALRYRIFYIDALSGEDISAWGVGFGPAWEVPPSTFLRPFLQAFGSR
jgi:hypothetical protein